MGSRWPRLGGQLGLLCVAAGLVVIALGWDGAASEYEVDAQIPYLVSGGAFGLALVGLGIGLFVVQSARHDRARLEARIEELARSVSRLASAAATAAGPTATGAAGIPAAGSAGPDGRIDESEVVVAGTDSYHRPDCRLVAGKDLDRVTVGAATAEGLEACRVCVPPGAQAVPR